MGVDAPPAEHLQERLAGKLHETGQDDEVRCVRTARVGERAVPVRPGAEVLHPQHERLDPGTFGTSEPLDPVTVGPHGDDLRAVRRILGRVDEGLQVRAGAGDQDHHPHRAGSVVELRGGARA